MTPDSFQYMSAAESFRLHGMFLSPDGSPYTNWPPLMPLVLSIFSNPKQALLFIEIFCKVIIALVMLRFCHEYLQKTWMKVLFLLISLSGVHLLLISVFLWSEMIFMMLLFLHTYFVVSYFRQQSKMLGAFVLFTGFLLCLQRNAGVFWVAPTALWLFLFLPGNGQRKALMSVTYLVTCLSGWLFWNIHTIVHMPADPTFHGRAFFEDAANNLKLMSSAIGQSFIPLEEISVLMGVLIFTSIVVARSLLYKHVPTLTYITLCLVVYIVSFVLVPNLDIHDMERYYAVVFPLVLLSLFASIEKVVSKNSKLHWVTLVCLMLWASYPLLRAAKNALLWREMSCRGVSVK